MDEERQRSNSLASTTALSHQLSLSALPNDLARRLDLVDQVWDIAYDATTVLLHVVNAPACLKLRGLGPKARRTINASSVFGS